MTCRFFLLSVEGRPASIVGVRHSPHPIAKNNFIGSRIVTLPDYQGMGLAMALMDRVSACYQAIGKVVHAPPAHMNLIRVFDRSENWFMKSRPMAHIKRSASKGLRSNGGRPNAVFEYCGPPHPDRDEANTLIYGDITS